MIRGTYGQGERGWGVGAISTARDGRCCCDRCSHRSTKSQVEVGLEDIIVNDCTTKKILKSKYIFCFMFNWSVYPQISSTKSGPRPELECEKARGVKGRCAPEPPRPGCVAGTEDWDAAVAGTEDAAVARMQHMQQQCRHWHQRVILPSQASLQVWSKSSRPAHLGCTGVFSMIHTTRIRSGCKGSVFNGSYHEDPVRLEEKNIIFLPDSPETSQKSPLYLMDPGTKRNAHKTDPSYDEGEERCFPARFLVVFFIW